MGLSRGGNLREACRVANKVAGVEGDSEGVLDKLGKSAEWLKTRKAWERGEV